MLFQLNRSKWTHFTEQNCSAETAVSIELQVKSTFFGNYFVQKKVNNIKAIFFFYITMVMLSLKCFNIKSWKKKTFANSL